ncbi:MAG TPA: hypothetical protein VKU41_15955 [Polyangiaceae bacterium]|nr:hypothetical protein [Polyangiaceae bacterium]
MLEAHWSGLRFGEIRVQTDGGRHKFAVAVYVDDLDPDLIAVELFADGRGVEGPLRVSMHRGLALIGARGFTYEVDVPGDRPVRDYTPRIVSACPDSLGPLEFPFVLWAG